MVGHALDHRVQAVRVGFPADLEGETNLRGEATARFLDALHAPFGVEGHDAGADVGCRHLEHITGLAHGDFGSSAADVDVHNAGGVADRARAGTRAEGGEGGLECIARAHRDEFPRLRRKQFSYGSGVAAAHCDPGEDQGARVDSPGIDSCELILSVDERAECRRVDGRVAGIRSEKDLGFVDDFALGYDIAVVETLEHEPGKDEVRGGGADVDPDAGEADLVLGFEAAPDIAEEDPAARFPAHAKPDYFVVGATYHPGSIRFGTPLFASVSRYSLRMNGSSIQYGMEVPPSGMSIAV